MKTLRTHLRPHLDDICAFWLLKRYLPEAKDAELAFVPAAERLAAKDTDDLIHIGVGRGKYDEHKGDVGDCATTLVWKDILTRTTIEAHEKAAVQKIVDWAFLEDTGMLGAEPHRAFAIPSLLTGYFESHARDSMAETLFGFELLDALIVTMRAEVQVDREWENRVEFDSRYGRAVAIVGSSRGLDAYAYGKGFNLALIMDPNGKYHTLRANGTSDIDLTPTYEALATADPNAEWYFHHSKKMLICGGEHAPFARTSSLSREQFIDLLKP